MANEDVAAEKFIKPISFISGLGKTLLRVGSIYHTVKKEYNGILNFNYYSWVTEIIKAAIPWTKWRIQHAILNLYIVYSCGNLFVFVTFYSNSILFKFLY